MNKELIEDKKPVQLKLSSMSSNWQPVRAVPRSGKHHSQWMQKIQKKIRKEEYRFHKKNNPSLDLTD